MAIRIGINGLGRIGRGFLRLSLGRSDFEVVALNDLAAPPILAHLLRHDSVAGRLDRDVRAAGEAIVADGRTIPCTSAPRPSEIRWPDVDIVIEATGRFVTRAAAAGHLAGRARRVVISSPSDDADLTVCFGVNHEAYDPARHVVVSNASCTTNAMAAVLSVADAAFGVEVASMTTVHCYTNNQVLVDAPHPDPRRARAAGVSMIPTSTTAAAAIGQVMPGLAGRVRCLAVRVPTAAVSLIDLTMVLRRATTLDKARAAFREAAEGRLRGILGYGEEELVSIDYLGDSRSAILDAGLLALDQGTFLKAFAWYDNERGYVHRLADLVVHMMRAERRGGGS